MKDMTISRLHRIEKLVENYLDLSKDSNLLGTLDDIEEQCRIIREDNIISEERRGLLKEIEGLQETWNRDLPMSPDAHIAINKVFNVVKDIVRD